MEYIFFGNNISLAERLRKALEYEIFECITFQQLNRVLTDGKYIQFCVFIEKKDLLVDIPTIAQLHKAYPKVYIALISKPLSKEDKIPYLKVGVDCIISYDTSGENLQTLLSTAALIKQKEKDLSRKQTNSLATFHLPLWKRSFDILASLSAILLLSPLF